MSKKITTEEFILRANAVHDNKYNYSNTIYVDAKTKVAIFCPAHGIFAQLPFNHLSGKGCLQCGTAITSRKQRSNTDDFVKKSILVHGIKYNYDKVVYVGSKIEVVITCPIHGDFKQVPSEHLSGYGCKKCGVSNAAQKQKLNTDEFIKRAKFIHGDKYDYSRVVYQGYKSKVTIICSEHGVFYQTPSGHLSGKGCLYCAISNNSGEKNNNYKGGVSSLEEHLRNVILEWKKQSMETSNYRCVVTGKRFDAIHHLYGFGKIINEALTELGLVSKTINQYTKDEISKIDETVVLLHQKYGLGVCLSKKVHDLFHKEYGYGNNTLEQFIEFKGKYEEGRYNQWLQDIG